MVRKPRTPAPRRLSAAPSFTFGIEEEYHLVDAETRDLAAAPEALLRASKAELGGRISPEFLRSQIEVATGICRSFASAYDELAELRRTVVRLAAAQGLSPIAAGTHPFARFADTATTGRRRYRKLAEDLAGAGRRLVICGMHVHVGLDDDDLRIDIMNQLRYFLPHLLALSTSSPFWEGEDTGLKSYRLAAYGLIPRTGIPGRFESWNEYARTVDVLVRAGVVADASRIWWDIRPSAHAPTLEMRVTDVVTRLKDAITIAALYVCLARMLWRLRRANQRWRTYPVFLLDENRWRAQRYGVSGSLLDLGKGELVAFADLADELIHITAEDADALGCTREVARIRIIAAEGTSADRQLATFAGLGLSRGRDGGALAAVVDRLAAETAAA